jgi:hypothetical protein
MTIEPLHDSGALPRLIGGDRATKGMSAREEPRAALHRDEDRVELGGRPVRGVLVDRVRREIEAGSYDDQARLSEAADAMLRVFLDG